MKKDKFLQMARLLLTPLVMVLLGLLLLLRPDSASALVGRVIGWILVVIVLGGLMAWDRLKLGKLLSDGDDGIIDV